MEVSGKLHAPAALPLGKEPPVSIGWKDGLAPEPFWTVSKRKIPIPRRESKPDHPIVQPVASRYTEWVLPGPIITTAFIKIIQNRLVVQRVPIWFKMYIWLRSIRFTWNSFVYGVYLMLYQLNNKFIYLYRLYVTKFWCSFLSQVSAQQERNETDFYLK
jgi:hypothetical protein